MRIELIAGAILCAFSALAATGPSSVTFTKDVAPVLEKNCQGCHRPGEAAPFPLLTYEQARPWAKAMKEAVLLKKMPPWFADPHYGKFSNDRSLSQKEIDTLAAWADAGAPQGGPKDMPAPVDFIEGWAIPKPDVIIEFPRAFQIPASGTIEYQKVVVPSGFTEDKWVQFAEARIGSFGIPWQVRWFCPRERRSNARRTSTILRIIPIMRTRRRKWFGATRVGTR